MNLGRVDSLPNSYVVQTDASSANNGQQRNARARGRRQGSRELNDIVRNMQSFQPQGRQQSFQSSASHFEKNAPVVQPGRSSIQVPVTPVNRDDKNSVRTELLQQRASRWDEMPASELPIRPLAPAWRVVAVTPLASSTSAWSSVRAAGIPNVTHPSRNNVEISSPYRLLSYLRQSLRHAVEAPKQAIDTTNSHDIAQLSTDEFIRLLGKISTMRERSPRGGPPFDINHQPWNINSAGSRIQYYPLSHLLIISSSQLRANSPNFETAVVLAHLKKVSGFNKHHVIQYLGHTRNHWQLACMYGTRQVIDEVGRWTLENDTPAIRNQWWAANANDFTPIQLMMQSIHEIMQPLHGNLVDYEYFSRVQSFCIARFESLLNVMRKHYLAALKEREPGKICSNYLDYWAPSWQIMNSADGQWNIHRLAQAAGGDELASRINRLVQKFRDRLERLASIYKNARVATNQSLNESSLSFPTSSTQSEDNAESVGSSAGFPADIEHTLSSLDSELAGLGFVSDHETGAETSRQISAALPRRA